MLLTRKQLEQREKDMLAPYAVTNLQSQGRVYKEKKDFYRLDFQRDRDRIIHSHAFRRLREKTQVFVASYGDHYRNRLTHSLEVAQLSRDIAKNLNLNEDLAESIALAHDLGHTPFGHAGEEKLNELMKDFGEAFEHNEQSRRIVEFLERKDPEYPGLNLTFEVRDGLIKHRSFYDQSEKQYNNFSSMEAQIVNLCDEIAYQNHDLDDGVRSGILHIEDLNRLQIWKQISGEIPKGFPLRDYFRYAVSLLIKLMVKDVYRETERRIRKYKIGKLSDVYKGKVQLVAFSDSFFKLHQELNEYLYKNLYFHPKVLRHSKRGTKILEFLFREYYKNPPTQLKAQVTGDNPLHVVVKDYIAGMTDEFARRQFHD